MIGVTEKNKDRLLIALILSIMALPQAYFIVNEVINSAPPKVLSITEFFKGPRAAEVYIDEDAHWVIASRPNGQKFRARYPTSQESEIIDKLSATGADVTIEQPHFIAKWFWRGASIVGGYIIASLELLLVFSLLELAWKLKQKHSQGENIGPEPRTPESESAPINLPDQEVEATASSLQDQQPENIAIDTSSEDIAVGDQDRQRRHVLSLHEAARAIVYRLSNVEIVEVKLTTEGEYTDGTTIIPPWAETSKNQMSSLMALLAGSAIKDIVFGQTVRLECDEVDLKKAEELAVVMIDRGVGKKAAFDNIASMSKDDYRRATPVGNFLEEMLIKTRLLLAPYEELVLALAKRLSDEGTMTGEEIKAFMSEFKIGHV